MKETEKNIKEALLGMASKGYFFDIIRLFRQEIPIKSFATIDEVEESRKEKIKELLNYVDVDGNNLFLLAISNGHLNIAQWLVEKGASLDKKNNAGHSALSLAVQKNYFFIVRWLVEEKNVPVDEKELGNTPLMWASHLGHLEIARFLIEKGASLTVCNASGYSLLQLAALNGHVEMLRYFVDECGLSLDEKLEGQQDATVFSLAIQSNHLKIVQWMLFEKKFPPDEFFHIPPHAEVRLLFTPLMVAAVRGDLDIVKSLVQYGVSLEAESKEGETAVMFAFHGSNLEVVQYLYKEGASFEGKSKEANALLGICKSMTPMPASDALEWVKLILSKNKELLEVPTTEAGNNTPLLYAIQTTTPSTRNYKLGIVEYLLRQGASLTTQNTEGDDAIGLIDKQKDADLQRILSQEIQRRAKQLKNTSISSQLFLSSPFASPETRAAALQSFQEKAFNIDSFSFFSSGTWFSIQLKDTSLALEKQKELLSGLRLEIGRCLTAVVLKKANIIDERLMIKVRDPVQVKQVENFLKDAGLQLDETNQVAEEQETKQIEVVNYTN